MLKLNEQQVYVFESPELELENSVAAGFLHRVKQILNEVLARGIGMTLK